MISGFPMNELPRIVNMRELPRVVYCKCPSCGKPATGTFSSGCVVGISSVKCLHCDQRELEQANAARKQLEEGLNEREMKQADALASITDNYEQFLVSGDRKHIRRIAKSVASYPQEGIRILAGFLKNDQVKLRQALWAAIILAIDNFHVESREFMKTHGLSDPEIDELIRRRNIENSRTSTSAPEAFGFSAVLRAPAPFQQRIVKERLSHRINDIFDRYLSGTLIVR